MSNGYVKNEMGPPSARATGTVTEIDDHDPKQDTYPQGQGSGHLGHGASEGESDHGHESDYIHSHSGPYNGNRASYSYSSAPAVGSTHGEHAHLSPEMTSSPHANGSGRATPRNSTAAKWAPGYHTPPRGPPSSNLYSVMSDTRNSAPNGASNGDGSYLSGMNYSSTMNGSKTSGKRGRDDDEDQDAHGHGDGRDPSGDAGFEGLKRRKTIREGSVGGPVGGGAYEPASLQRTKSAALPRKR